MRAIGTAVRTCFSREDLYGVEGLPIFAGTPNRLPPEWEHEGPVVAALTQQLAAITGKTHMVEFAFGVMGTNPHWDTPRNPWDATARRIPGGSSSGAGVSLAEGSALAALGSDTGGSVRAPACMTGQTGLKTSMGRWSTEGIVPLSPTLDTAGVLARSVEDCAVAFAAIDPAIADPENFLELIETMDIGDITLGLIEDPLFWDGCSPGINEAVRGAVSELEAAGATVLSCSLPRAAEAYDMHVGGSVASAELAAFLEQELPDWIEHIDPFVQSRIHDGGAITAKEYLIRRRHIEDLSVAGHLAFVGFNVLAMPTLAGTPPTLDEVADLDGYRRHYMLLIQNLCVVNIMGLCAITMAAGLDAAGMPVGLQLIARNGEDERLLAAALACERVLGTGRQRLGPPPLCR